jgi:tRNA(Ile)-lysidine synthase
MLQRFKQFIKQENLFLTNQKILIAVSGGIDSVALCHLMHEAGYSFGIAHCNFKLRGDDSEKDEKFVNQLSKRFDAPFYTKRFDTLSYTVQNKISVQMAARDLRYAWFEEIRKKNHYDFIAVAHHQDDEVETFFINLIRGTGIAGLHGIKAKSGKIVRPLLFTGRKEIEEFSKKNKIKFREDKSNQSTKYLRNKIRLQFIPMLKELNPDIESAVKSEIQRIKQIENIFQKLVKEKQEEIQSIEGNIIKFNISKLLQIENNEIFLYEFLKPFGFSGDIIQQILKSLKAESGRQFMSDSYRILKDREYLIVSPYQTDDVLESFIVTKGYKELQVPVHLKFSENKFSKKTDINKDKNFAYLDLEKLHFPLQIRKWERGDYFIPFGMTGKKKISDYFTDIKLSLFEKENTWLLCNGDDIIWVIGHRIDERYRITTKTKNIFIAEKV